MLLYTAIWLFLFFLSLKEQKNGVLYYSIIIFLVLLAGLRDISIGTDTSTYMEIYEWVSDESAKYIEPGWYYLNRVVYLLGGNFTILLTIVSILTLIPIIHVSKAYPQHRNEILFYYFSMYLYLNSFNGMRQYLAVSIGFLALELFRNNEVRKCLLFIFIAFLFHYSAAILLLVFMLKLIKVNKKSTLVFLLVSTFLLGSVAGKSFFYIITGKYASYLEKEEFGFREESISMYLLTILMDIMLFLVFSFKSQKYDRYWLNVFTLGILLLNVTFKIGLAARLILYFTIAQIIVFPLFLVDNKIKNKVLVRIVVAIYFALLFFRNFAGGSTGGDIVPYKFFFI